MTVDDLVAVVDHHQSTLHFVSKPQNLNQERILPVTLVYPPPLTAAASTPQYYVEANQQHLDTFCYRTDHPYFPTTYALMSTADFSYPPPTTSNAAPAFRPTVTGGGGVIVTGAPPVPFVPIPAANVACVSTENFTEETAPPPPAAYTTASENYGVYPYAAAQAQPIVAYNHHHHYHQPPPPPPPPPVTFVQNITPQQYPPHAKTITVHGQRKATNHGRNQGGAATSSVAFSSSDTGSSLMKASAASDTASSCSGGGAAGCGRAASGIGVDTVYHPRHHRGNNRFNNSNGNNMQLRRYSDPRPSTSRQHHPNHGQVLQPNRDAVSDIGVGPIVMDSSTTVTKANTAKSTGVDSVDSTDSGLTADHSSPEHRTVTPTNDAPPPAPPRGTPIRPQNLPFHSADRTAVVITGSRYEATADNRSVHNSSSMTTSNTGGNAALNAGGGGGGGGPGESRSSSPAPPASSGDGGGSNGGGTNSLTAVTMGFPPLGPHAVYVHVNLGETLSVRVGNEIQHIPGPATVRMVSSQSAGPPLPLPLHVPPGHVVQQIVDENGTLRHLILSPQTPQAPPVTAGGPFPCVNMPNTPMGPSVQFVPVNGNVPHSGVHVHGPVTVAGSIPANGPGTVPVAVLAAAPTDCPPGPPYHPIHGAPPHTTVLQPSSTPMVAVAPISAHPNPNVPPSANTRHPLHLHTNPPHICQLHINGGNGEDSHVYVSGERGFAGRTTNRGTAGGKTCSATVTSTNQTPAATNNQRNYHNDFQVPENSSPLHDTTMDDDTSAATSGGNEDDEISKIAEMLSRIPAPQVCDIGPRDALVQWQPFDCSEASASGGPFPQIDASEFTYEILLYERLANSKPTSNYRCQADQLQQQWLANLKPSTEYFVRLRALLEERGLHGEPSSAVAFKTKPTYPDKMQAPRVTQRAKTSIVLRWQPPCDNGAKIAAFHLELDDSGTGSDGAFREVYRDTGKQFKLQKLQPSTLYRVRVAASNQHGKGEFSDILLVQTTGAPPPPPEPPVLIQASSHSLSLQWKRRDGDEEFQLFMEDPQTGHGYLPVSTTRDVSYVVQSLMRFKEYRFRLTSSNDDGRSLQSEVVTFKTLPSRPQAPARPHAKGRVASSNVKIAWEPPKDTGGSDITHYYLDMCNENAGVPNGNWTTVYEGPSNEHHVAGLEPGVSYRFRVACCSLGGRSAYSDDLSVTTSPVPPGPCRPPFLHGKAKPTSLHLKWSSPEFHGGAEISEYELMIESSSSTEADTAAFSSLPSTIPSQTVYQGPRTDFVVSAGLLPGRTYGFRVRSYNRAGAGQWSERYDCQTASAPPETPQRLRVAGRTATSVSLAWDAPSSNNGAPITEYRLHQACKLISGESQSDNDASPTRVAEKEMNEVIMEKAASISPTRSRSAARTASSSTSVEASPSSSIARTPSSVECLAEVGYGPVTQISVGPGLMYEAKGLKPATDYLFRVQAINCSGCSRLTDPLFTRTTPGVPEAPINVKAEAQSLSEILIMWEAPFDNGTPIVGYYIDVSPSPSIPDRSESSSGSSVPIELPAGSTQHVVENLLPETVYRFRVQANNDVGIGPYSASIKAVTFSPPPSPPSLELAVASHNWLKLRWNEPSSSSSSPENPITYTIEMENRSGAFSQVAADLPTRSCKVPRLSEYTLYRFRIRACSATGGAGIWSDVFEFKTLRMPSPALKTAPRISNVTENSCQIDWQPLKLAGIGFSLLPGEKIQYAVQIQGPLSSGSNNEDIRTVYKGPSTSFHMSGLSQGCNYRVRVCSIRISPPDSECGKEVETFGAPSPTCSLSTVAPESTRRRSSDSVGDDTGKDEVDTGSGLTSLIRGGPRQLSDRQWAMLILVMFSLVALLVAFMLQRFIPSTHSGPGSMSGTTTNPEQTAFSNQAR